MTDWYPSMGGSLDTDNETTANEPERSDGISRRTVVKASIATVGTLGIATPATANDGGVTTQTADVFGQGPNGPVVAEDGAMLRRTRDGISMRLSMSTPEPGTYRYPSEPEGGAWTREEGPPEVFTLWCFVFDPEQPPFDPPKAEWTAVYNPAGHVVDGSTLTLSGRASRDTNLFAGEPLENPQEAEVHLAVAPHGALDPELLPEALNTPTGPGPEIWWLALFDPPT
jgi:hypothetical protein